MNVTTVLDHSYAPFTALVDDALTAAECRFAPHFDGAFRRGQALLFQHAVRHEGCAVDGGRKYVLRTDVMYRR